MDGLTVRARFAHHLRHQDHGVVGIGVEGVRFLIVLLLELGDEVAHLWPRIVREVTRCRENAFDGVAAELDELRRIDGAGRDGWQPEAGLLELASDQRRI
jgi:hypothetical protein